MAEEKVTRSKGVVMRFNDEKGYGFIQPDEGGDDLFVHQSEIKSDGYRTLSEGQEVEFTIILEGDKTKATDVTAPGGAPFDQTSGRGNNRNNRGGGGGYGDRRNQGNGFGYQSGGQGGECYSCGELGHMARDCINGGGGLVDQTSRRGNISNNRGGGGGYGDRRNEGNGSGYQSGGRAVDCYKCGELGHMARDCNMSGGDGGLVDQTSRRGNNSNNRGTGRGYDDRKNDGDGFVYQSGGRGGECYNCGVYGHMARDCNGGSRGRGTGAGCYNCGGQGHMARECPSGTRGGGGGGGGGACYSCGEPGHIARDCTRSAGGAGGGGGSGRGGGIGKFGGGSGGGGNCFNCGEPGHLARECKA